MRRKIYTLICAGFIMAMAAIQVQAGEIKNIDGFSIEVADYTRLGCWMKIAEGVAGE